MPSSPCLVWVRQGRHALFLLILVLSLWASWVQAGSAGKSQERNRAHKSAVVQEKTDEDHDEDYHKPLFPLDTHDFWLLGGATLTSFLAANAGIGGGGILLPLLVFVAQFTPRLAAALSNVCILGGSMANFVLNAQRSHPVYRFLPLIDYDLILMMEPPTVLGALLGGFANKVLTTWITTSFMAIILTLVALQLARKALTPSTLKAFKERHLPFPQRGDAPLLTSDSGQQHSQGSHVMNGSFGAQPLPEAADSVSIPMQGHHGHTAHPAHHLAQGRAGPQQPQPHGWAALSSLPRSDGWMPLESISEASSVHYGTAYSTVLEQQHSGLGEGQHAEVSGDGEQGEEDGSKGSKPHSRRNAKGFELKGGEGGIPRYKLAVEDSLGLHLKKNSGRRNHEQVPLPTAAAIESKQNHHHHAFTRTGYKLPYQLRVQEEADRMLVEEVQQDKLLEQGHLLDGVNGSLDRPVKGFNEAGKAQQLEGFKPPWGRLSWLGGLSLWVAFTQLIANKYVECGSPSYWLAVLSVIPAAMLVLLHTRARVLKEHRHHAFLPRQPSHHPSHSVVGQELSVPLLSQEDGEVRDSEQQQQQQQQQLLVTGKAPSPSTHTAVSLPQPPAQPIKPEIEWTPKTTLQYPAMCSAAGVVAGVCGVGGGIIKGPLMLALGVRPEVATASSATMILATSLSATTVYAGLGTFSQVMDYALAMATLGFIATAVGQALLHVYTKKKMQRGSREEQGHRNSSVIIKIMATIMVISACTMGYAAVLEVHKVVKNPSLISKFGHICPQAKGDSSAADQGFEDDNGSNSMFLTI
mmetsp:Transcript_13773/g.37210  ORF Transcript_13773/g.37210 Transcript_13773/m.37210 type:complete len:806 (+) Transcript_13773:143-2560(+)|eukprot:CAMPEP_0202343366 /NCGR_PEP_ID=MMETSP1126-20121109/3516_1 /ASSEMBLY_ACC=CAM_ASM_000457 /TAXON_ID=3047 /ORGANISM="Dunaliella tertiolecta, Strain CCMP1320" /LENGTH=805 /DNA_ID=CAMNT_0048934421 /DNA_START=60 /DNA_END=2477 /DNA_ORIENTATION=+